MTMSFHEMNIQCIHVVVFIINIYLFIYENTESVIALSEDEVFQCQHSPDQV